MEAANARNKKIISARFFGTQTEGAERLFGLDLMRAASILMAMFYHALYFFIVPFPKLQSYFYFTGLWSIEVFFVMSGFLIGNMLSKTYIQSDTYNAGIMFSFWKRRWIRTLPNYYFVLLINLLLLMIPGVRGEGFSWKFFVFLQGFTSRPPTFFPETWSLAIEEWFYFLLPILFGVFHILLAKRMQKKYLILLLLIFSIVVFSAIRLVYCINVNPEFDWDLRKIVIYQLDGVVYGALAGWFYKFYPDVFKNKKLVFLISGIALVCGWYILLRLFHNNALVKALWFTFTSLGFSMFIPYMYYFNFSYNLTRLKAIITHISLVSYSGSLIYLYMVQQTSLLIFTPVTFVSGLINFIFYMAAVILLSTVMYNYFERPILLLRK